MSGGVDSSVAALLIRDAGYECEAVMLRLYSACKNGDNTAIARRVAERLGIPFGILDFRRQFLAGVVSPFISSYLGGDTPNPCVACNRHIKFGALTDYAADRGFTRVATGHYARIEYDPAADRYLLMKGADASKDQSYMLYTLSQRQLSRAAFPIGGMLKSEVREIAEKQGFPNARARESQDICFIQTGNYMDFIRAQINAAKERTADDREALPDGPVDGEWDRALSDGPIVDETGAVVGRHKGAAGYTVGQRKGLGLAMPEPVYVYAKSVAENKVYVGPETLLYSKSATALNVNLIPLSRLTAPLHVKVKTRYRHAEQPAIIEQISDDEIRVEFDSPQRAVTSGQAAVFYDGSYVIGGGTIK